VSELSGNGVAGAVFEFLLFALVPSGHICKVAGHTRDLGYIMTAAFRADGFAAEGTVFNRFRDIVTAVAVVKRAHDFKFCLAAAGAGILIDNVVAGVAFVPALFNWNIFKSGVFFFQAELFWCPVHGNILSDRTDKMIDVTIREISDLCGDMAMRSFPGISASFSCLCHDTQ
jgi:hypothetical protein